MGLAPTPRFSRGSAVAAEPRRQSRRLEAMVEPERSCVLGNAGALNAELLNRKLDYGIRLMIGLVDCYDKNVLARLVHAKI